MIQLFCPACENVFQVEEIGADGTLPCPACKQPINALARRKARSASDPRVVPAPARITCPSWVPPASQPSTEDEENWEEPELPVPSPEPPRFAALPYRPEGGVRVARLPLFVGGVLLAGAGLGALASVVGQSCYIVLLFPLLVGLGLAALTILLCQLCQVRSPVLAGLFALAGGVGAVGTMHLLDFRHALRLVETDEARMSPDLVYRLRVTPEFGEYLDAVATEGLTIAGREGGGLNLGRAGTYLNWGLELLLVAVVATIGGAIGARDPFCTACNRWKEERFLGTLADGGPEQRRQLRQGRLAEMSCWKPSTTAGDLVLTVSVCPGCGCDGPIELRVERNPRSPREPAAVGVAQQWTYPGEALPVLEKLFTPARDEPTS